MIHPQIGRLQFLKSTFGALGFSLLPGSRLWAAPKGWEPRDRAELVFGFVTDTHIRRDGRPERETIWRHTPDTYLRNAFRFFRDAGVDTVMHGGDMAHRGLRCEMQFTADVWNEVFPGDRLPDGRPVAKLFVTGNHEWNRNNSFEFKVYPDPDVRERNVLHNDMPRHWREVWGEPYTKAWHKVVKGYHFFGEHWEDAYGDVVPLLQKDAQSLKGRKPFFLVQHLMPGCAECGSRTSDALKSFPNAIVMFGHWHNSSADLTTIHHTDCVMVNGPSLRGNGRNRIPGYRPDARTQTDHDTIQHGYLVRVYSDMVVFERYDFRHGGKVGPDLVLPLGEYDSKPFSSSSLAATIGAPAFAAAAKPTLTDLGEHVALDIPPATARDPVPWKTRAPWVAQAIQAHDFDILGLQEVVAVQLDDLAEALKRGYGHIGVCRDDGARVGEAAPIFYSKARFELLDSGNFWLSEQPDVPGVKSWDTAFTRICTWGKFRDRVSGKQFAFFNTHLDHRGAVAKRKGMELIVARLRPHLDAGLPGIITGDFNTVEGEGPYNVAAANFRDAVMVSATKPVGPWRSAHGWRWRAAKDELTFDAAVACPKEERATRAFHDRIGGHRIDHVFVSPQIRVRSVTTHTDANGRTYVSDHFPVSAVLEF